MKKNKSKKNNNFIFLIIQFFQLLVLILLKWNKIMMGPVLFYGLLVILSLLSLIVFYLNYSGNQNKASFALFIVFMCFLLNNFDYYRVSYNYNKYKKLYNYVANNLNKFKKEKNASYALLGKYDYLSKEGMISYEDKELVIFTVYDKEYLIYCCKQNKVEKKYDNKIKSIKNIDNCFYYVVLK